MGSVFFVEVGKIGRVRGNVLDMFSPSCSYSEEEKVHAGGEQ